MKFSKKDLVFCLITGLYTGFIAWRIFAFLHLDIFDRLRVNIIFHLLGTPNQNVSTAWMIVLIPMVWIVGVNLGYFLGRWMPFFNQFGRFVVIGFTNFAVSAGVLNLMLALSGISIGIWYSVFVGGAFIIGTIHSYYWNKSWVFESGTNLGGSVEFAKFITVVAIAGLVNIVVASLLVNFSHPLFGITPEGWANVGGVAGSAAGLVFSFVGFRIVVFRKS